MDRTTKRREFIKRSALAAAGASGLVGGAARSDEVRLPGVNHPEPASGHKAKSAPGGAVREWFDGFSRLRPSRGNDPQSEFYLGKLVPQDPKDEPASELLKRIASEREQRASETDAAKRLNGHKARAITKARRKVPRATKNKKETSHGRIADR